MSRRDREPVIYWRIVPHNGGVVFALADRAEYVARLHRAIADSRTWREFAAAVPRREYQRVIRHLEEFDEPRPADGEKFDPEQLPGFSDGDYPPWLQLEIEDAVPRELLERYGKREITAVNGSYWHIEPEQVPALVEQLEADGAVVREMQDLPFH